MNEGRVVIVSLRQADGDSKLRPAVVLRIMPPFNDMLVCGISSQLQHYVPNFDEILRATDDDYAQSGLKTTSLIRLGFLNTLPVLDCKGVLGQISEERLERLQKNLSTFLWAKNV
ncbi:MAG: type II toxin-antitoxin system PemK/MazF family toxin [Candidatus Kapabacteria bacterium]|jgi:mRNA interferase MazF|nr:type II toxin-antitoxin system PemK/MazF family toxin [Candidatus Kapabacteria bacterium]